MKTVALVMLEQQDGRSKVLKAFLNNEPAERYANEHNDRYRNVHPPRYYYVDAIEVDETT